MDQNSSLAFDLNSQKGVASLLASLRASSLSSGEKNEIRDLVFSYTNGGGDVSIKIALEQKLKTHNLTPVNNVKPEVKDEQVKEAPKLPYGSSRPAPVFKAPALKEIKVIDAKVEEVIVKKESTPPAAPTPAPKVEEAVTPRPAKPEPEVSKAAVVPTGNTTETSKYLDRIREIKSAVNAQVGNPVNLVDIDNGVGREYMSALLEAMKRLSGGAGGQMELAMQRLETAFSAVEVAVKAHKAKEVTETTQEVKEEKPEPTLASNFKEVPKPVNPVQKEPEVTEVKEKEEVNPWQAAQETVLAAKTPPPPPPVQPTPVKEAVTPNTAPVNESGSVAATAPTATFQAKSILSEERLATPADLPLKAANDKSDSTDPLYSNEVSAGLEQLLSDWSLFKKSGLFGTGPKGKEHPLYKKIADLQIPLVLAGRFEGSTQEVKQSITDYMNGWRYEQGIIYERGETFEKYLRRVIKQILDLQKKRIPS